MPDRSPLDPSTAETRGLETLGAKSGGGLREPVPLAFPEEPIPDLPGGYEDDRVVLLCRDPRTLFVYWDLHPSTVKAAHESLSSPREARLRVYKLTGSEPELQPEIPVELGWGSYYLHGLESNRDYRVELVLVGAGGAERLLGRRSGVASLPPGRPSVWIEDRFASIPLDVALPAASVFAKGRALGPGGGDRRLHSRAWLLSGGESLLALTSGDETSSEGVSGQSSSGRAWSASVIKPPHGKDRT